MVSERSLEIHRHFGGQAGSYAIATPVNIEAIRSYCERANPRRVLELGAGIGTMAYSVLSASDASVDTYEDNAFCRERLLQNAGSWSHRLRIIPDYNTPPLEKSYDLVIVDGPDTPGLIERRAELTEAIVGVLDSVGSVFIEGARFPQRRAVQRALARRTCYRLERVRGAVLSEIGLVKGGLFVHVTKPCNSLVRRASHWGWILYDWSDLRDPRRRAKVKKRIAGFVNRVASILSSRP